MARVLWTIIVWDRMRRYRAALMVGERDEGNMENSMGGSTHIGRSYRAHGLISGVGSQQVNPAQRLVVRGVGGRAPIRDDVDRCRPN